MKRIKTIGLSAALALALTSIAGVSIASASGFISDEYPSVVRGEGVETTYLYVPGQFTSGCSTPELEGFMGEDSTATSAAFGEWPCTLFGYPHALSGNCELTFDPGEEVSTGTFEGTVGIGGGKCAGLEFSGEHCVLTLAPQSGAATFTNKGTGSSASVVVSVQMSDLDYTNEGGTFCSGPSGNNAQLEASWELRAENEGGEPTGLQVGQVQAGLLVFSEQFVATSFPVNVAGERGSGDPPFAFELPGVGDIECEDATFAGTEEMTEASSSLALTAEYGSCSVFEFPGTVAMNGCQFVPNQASVDIECPGEAQIEASAPALDCTVSFAPVTGLESIAYENVGPIAESRIDVAAELAGIDYAFSSTAEEGCFLDEYAGEDAEVVGSMLLEAFG